MGFSVTDITASGLGLKSPFREIAEPQEEGSDAPAAIAFRGGRVAFIDWSIIKSENSCLSRQKVIKCPTA
jgi:hypothetical protein